MEQSAKSDAPIEWNKWFPAYQPPETTRFVLAQSEVDGGSEKMYWNGLSFVVDGQIRRPTLWREYGG